MDRTGEDLLAGAGLAAQHDLDLAIDHTPRTAHIFGHAWVRTLQVGETAGLVTTRGADAQCGVVVVGHRHALAAAHLRRRSGTRVVAPAAPVLVQRPDRLCSVAGALGKRRRVHVENLVYRTPGQILAAIAAQL